MGLALGVMGPTTAAAFCVSGTADEDDRKLHCLQKRGVLIRYLRLFLLHYSRYLVVLVVPQGPMVDVVGAVPVGGGLLEVLPTALDKVAEVFL